MSSTIESNKAIVLRFNKECIEEGNSESFKELLSPIAINHTVPQGMPSGPESFTHFLNDVLRVGFPDISVEIADQIAEGDKVTSRKLLRGTHSGEFMGVPPTYKKVVIHVIDIIRIENGQYAEHWAMSNLSDVVKMLSSNK